MWGGEGGSWEVGEEELGSGGVGVGRWRRRGWEVGKGEWGDGGGEWGGGDGWINIHILYI